MKKLRFLLTTIAALLCSATINAHDFEVNGIYYEITSSSDLTVQVTYKGDDYHSTSEGYAGNVVIPETVTNNSKTYSVTRIADYAFQGCSGLTSVTIPNSVTRIGYSAFYGCTALTSITIPESVTSIGSLAFYGCSGLTSVNIPNSVTSIAYAAFTNCSGLTSVTIPNSITRIEGFAFQGCSGLTSVTIPNSVTSIEGYAFYGCSGLTSIIVDGGNSIYDSRENCNAIIHTSSNELVTGCKNTFIPNSVTTIGKSAFQECSGLTSVTIPNSVTTIGHYAFRGCSGLTSLTIGSGVTSIGSYAFEGCSGLTSVNIPNSVTSIERHAFFECSGLTSIIVDGGNSIYDSRENCNAIIHTSSNELVTGCKNTFIPNSVTTIGESAFFGCSGLTSVTIPNSVTSIGGYAFSGCSGLTSVTIANNVTTIDNYAFRGCSGLTSVTIPNSVTTIGHYAFRGCSGLTSLTIGSGVTSIGSYAFEGCSGLTININTKNLKNWFSGYSSIENIVLGNDVENIENGALNNMPNLKTVTIGTGMLSIGTRQTAPIITLWLPNTPPKGYENLNGKINYVANEQYTGLNEMHVYKYLSSLFDADGIKYVPVNPSNRTCDALFCFDKNITNAIINKTVSFKNVAMNVNNVMPYAYYKHNIKTASLYNDGLIGDRIFSDCTSLESIHLGDSVTSIGNYAFNNCSSLTEISIPKATTSIGDYAFSGCKNITNVIIEDKDGETELTLGSNRSKALFSDCPLDSVYIGGNIKYNTSSSYGYSPFYRNTSLRTVVITDKEDKIYANEFYGCTNLKNVQIGDGVKSIGDWAFSGCSNLDYFAFGTGLQSIGKEAFSDCVNVTKLISYAVAPPKCGEMALDDINKWNCTLQIPQQSLAAYQAADQWKEFFFIEGFDATGIEGVTADNPSLNAKANVYTIDGTLIKGNANISNLSNELPKGIYIVNGKKFYVK